MLQAEISLMIEFESDQIVDEVLASLPFTFGFRPRESVVFTIVSCEPPVLRIGASARLDLAALEGPAALAAIDYVGAALHRTGATAALVTIHTDREIGLWVLELAERVTDRWPFAEHGGYHVLSQGSIHAFASDGEPRGRRDELELLTTRFAMSQPAQSFAAGPDEFRYRRAPRGVAAERVAAELGALPPVERAGPEQWAAVTAAWWEALDRGGPRGARGRALLLHALDHIPFRDGVLTATLGAVGDRPADLTHVDVDAFDHAKRPDPGAVAQVTAVLRRLAHFAPPCRGVQPLAMAAFLAWWSGDGARARILSDQALEEDPAHGLAHLIQDALWKACPPPWYGAEQNAGRERRSSAAQG